MRRRHTYGVTNNVNRDAFGKDGPDEITGPHSFRPDTITEEVFELTEQRFGDHPGTLDKFALPVTHAQARTTLRDFVQRSLRNSRTPCGRVSRSCTTHDYQPR